MSFKCCVEFADIARMMLVMMDLHRPGIDVRLQRIKWVGQIRERVGHVVILSWFVSGRKCSTTLEYTGGKGMAALTHGPLFEMIVLQAVQPDLETDL